MKRIVICADGTWNLRDQLDEKTQKRRPTNVTKLARAVLPRDTNGVDQIVIYCDGVGTGRGMDKFTGGAFGLGIEDNVRDLYRAIVYNYTPGDQLFFFGFSRGAFTVRTLAGFMNFADLVEKDDDYFVPDLYACYEKQQGKGTQMWQTANRRIVGTRPCPPIEMIGVWDTVGALGAPGFLGQLFNKNKYQHHDINLHPTIRHAYHALAIDEHRKPFAPNLWRKPPGWAGVLEQVWFAGVHSNIGGGYTPDGLANIALHWMVERANRNGLATDSKYLDFFEPHFDAFLADSMTTAYKALGSIDRPVGAAEHGEESIHPAAIQRMQAKVEGYDPASIRAFLAKQPGQPT